MKKKMRMTRLITMFLVCVLMLSGCGTEEANNEQQDIVIPKEEDTGRYSVSEVSVPDPLLPQNREGSDYVGESFEGFTSDPQGKPAIYYNSFTIEDEEYFATLTRWALTDTNEWKAEELCENSLSEFLNRKYEQVSWEWFRVNQFRRGDDGSLYAFFIYCVSETSQEDGTEMQTYQYSVLQIDEENDQIFEIPLADFSYSEEVRFRLVDGMPTGVDLTDYHVFEDGKILIIYTESGGEYGKLFDGDTGQTLQDMGNIVSGRNVFAFGESELIFFTGDKRFRVLSIPGLEEDNTFGSALSEEVIGKDWYYGMNPDTWELFLCNETGIYSAVSYQDSDEVECLTANTDLSALDSVVSGEENMKDFFVGEKNDFYICLVGIDVDTDDNVYEILHYEKKE